MTSLAGLLRQKRLQLKYKFCHDVDVCMSLCHRSTYIEAVDCGSGAMVNDVSLG